VVLGDLGGGVPRLRVVREARHRLVSGPVRADEDHVRNGFDVLAGHPDSVGLAGQDHGNRRQVGLRLGSQCCERVADGRLGRVEAEGQVFVRGQVAWLAVRACQADGRPVDPAGRRMPVPGPGVPEPG
jgi:hypothetical protein